MASPAEGTVRLRPGREKSVREGHPWLFSGAVAAVSGAPALGALVRVEDDGGRFLAWGHFSPVSQIRVRILERREEAPPDEAWVRRQIDRAIQRRSTLLGRAEGSGSACRLCFSEADLLPGLIVDRYEDRLAVQILSAGMERLRPTVLDELARMLAPAGIVERSDPEHRALEGLPPAGGWIAGEAPAGPLRIRDGRHRFTVDLAAGQKTGFYLDQRLNRPAVAAWAAGRRVLDAFCYTGAFSVHAAGAGAASLLLLDSSAEALRAAEAHLDDNDLGTVAREARCGNAFAELRRLRDEGRTFDMVILDPPRLAPTKAHAARAARAYKDANLLALKLLAPEGILATFSCSGGIPPDYFREIVRWAAKDAGREVQVLQALGAAPDHPVRLDFPESEYLKGLLCRAL
jgi:23S rRNA (cytosine1962-C5)-methyltransferase